MAVAVAAPYSVVHRPANKRVLLAVGQYDLLKRDQLQWLIGGSPRLIKESLKQLCDEGYLEWGLLPVPIKCGGAPYVYRLTRKGHTALMESGYDLPPRNHNKLVVTQHTAHQLSANDAIISATIACEDHSTIRLMSFLNERAIRRRNIRVQVGPNRPNVSPDAFLYFFDGAFPRGVALELDRSTEHDVKWRMKVRELIALASGPHEEAFGIRSLTIAIIATEGTYRRDELKYWTELELRKVPNPRSWAARFAFTGGDPYQLDPAYLWFGPSWWRPFAQTPSTLWEDGV